MLKLPYAEKSVWRESYDKPAYPQLKEDVKVDAAVVGAGITGLTTAYLLKQAGMSVAVLDKNTVGGGTTGRTTGKVTSQHNLLYYDLAERLGKPVAKLYGEANQAAVEQVAAIIEAENIDCDWQRDDNYVYTADPHKIKQFQQEARVAAELGLPGSLETITPLPFEVRAAVKFSNQGKLNAQKYVLGLAQAIDGDGSYVYEHSQVIGLRENRVKTPKAKVFAKHVVVATNVPTLPLIARGTYCALEYPMESYIVAGRPSRTLSGMYISPDKHHYSILPINVDNKPVILIGGESHVSGLRGGKKGRYHRLADYAEEYFGVAAVTHHWSDRDYLSYDGPPLAGRLYPWSKRLYVATAFRKWGLSNGTAAAMLICDLIQDKPNSWAKIFDPQRSGPIKAIPHVMAEHLTG